MFNNAVMHPKDDDGVAKSAVWSGAALFAQTHLPHYLESLPSYYYHYDILLMLQMTYQVQMGTVNAVDMQIKKCQQLLLKALSAKYWLLILPVEPQILPVTRLLVVLYPFVKFDQIRSA